jgi:hypothetical protein
VLGAIQIMRDTLSGGGGFASLQCHQMTQGGGVGSTKMSRVIFCLFLNKISQQKPLKWEGVEPVSPNESGVVKVKIYEVDTKIAL